MRWSEWRSWPTRYLGHWRMEPNPRSRLLRKFTTTLEDATSKERDPSRRQALIDAAINLADELSAAQMQLPHSITGSVTHAIRGPSGGTKQ